MSKSNRWLIGTSATAIWIAIVGFFTVAFALPYGSGTYGQCSFQTSCPVPAGTTSPPPPAGTPAPDSNPAPGTVAADVDKDGNPENVTDTDSNPSNGYETFNDPDGSSKLIVITDGEHDGKKDFLIDINNDGTPDVYWSPDDQYTAGITISDTATEKAWLYTNAKGQVEAYVFERKQISSAPSTGSTGNEAAPQHRLTSNNFGGAVYQKIGKVVQDVPKPVAYSFPYVLLALIGILIGRLLFQTRREIHRIRMIKAASVREKQLELEKQNFLMLASHYLRTPVTIIKGNIELAQSLKAIPDSALPNLQATVTAVQTEISSLLNALGENKSLTSVIQPPIVKTPVKKAILSPFVIGPVLGMVALLIFANILFVDFRVIEPKFVDFLVQILLVVILGQWFISSVRKRHIHSQELIEQQFLLDQQRSIDEARAEFITKATQGLSVYLGNLGKELDALTAAGHDTTRIRKGYDQLTEIMHKFLLAVSLQAPTVTAQKQKIDSARVVQDLVGREQPKASNKNLQISSTAQGGTLTQNQQLANMVLDSLVDNAIKYSPENSVVSISQQNDDSLTAFKVLDQGLGMSPEQLDLLFKPFSRTESAETFNTEGLGFSLYLSRLIAHYMGGEVSIDSSQGKGTEATLSLPQV